MKRTPTMIEGIDNVTLDELFRQITPWRLQRFNRNQREIAESLGIGFRTLSMWLRRWGVEPKRGGRPQKKTS